MTEEDLMKKFPIGAKVICINLNGYDINEGQITLHGQYEVVGYNCKTDLKLEGIKYSYTATKFKLVEDYNQRRDGKVHGWNGGEIPVFGPNDEVKYWPVSGFPKIFVGSLGDTLDTWNTIAAFQVIRRVDNPIDEIEVNFINGVPTVITDMKSESTNGNFKYKFVKS